MKANELEIGLSVDWNLYDAGQSDINRYYTVVTEGDSNIPTMASSLIHQFICYEA